MKCPRCHASCTKEELRVIVNYRGAKNVNKDADADPVFRVRDKRAMVCDSCVVDARKGRV